MTNVNIHLLYESMHGQARHSLISPDVIYRDCKLSKSLADCTSGELHKMILKARRELKKKYPSTDGLNKYLTILERVLPPVPPNLVGNCQSSSDTDVHKLIESVLEKMFNMLVYYNFSVAPPSETFRSVFVKVVRSASINQLRCVKTFLSSPFLEMMRDNLEPRCDELKHIFGSTLVVLLERLPFLCRLLLTNEVAFKIRLALIKNAEKTCPLVVDLGKLYDRFNLENELKRSVPTWCPLLEACKKFQASELTGALEILSGVVEMDSFCEQQMIQSGILSHLENVLIESTYGEEGILKFLRAFLNIGRHVTEPATHPYRMLVKHLLATMKYQWNYLDRTVTRKQMACNGVCNSMHTLEREIHSTLNLLQCLYVLNSTWYRWFDVAREPQIIEREAFLCQSLADQIRVELKDPAIPASTLMRYCALIKICPAILPFQLKDVILRRKNEDESSKSIKILRTSRENILVTLRDAFCAHLEKIKSKWFFEFDNERGAGCGPTKEAYSLISHKLQLHCFDFWRGNPVHSAPNSSTLYTYSADGLFPKKSNDAEVSYGRFKFFGQLMAKVFLDSYQLDIPLSEELFCRLVPGCQGHLRKDYYDIPSVFPATNQLIQQLIWVKGKANAIRTNPLLSDEIKQEMISSLHLPDGSSFDNLFLNFTVPGTNEELLENGYDIILSPLNVDRYLQALSIKMQMFFPTNEFKAMKDGFNEVLPLADVGMFLPEELQTSLCGSQVEEWSVEYLGKCCIMSNGYNKESEQIQFLFQVMSSFSMEEKKMFLQFTTGRSLMPAGGLRLLTPPLHICRLIVNKGDHRLPSVLTCTNTIFLPEYDSVEMTRDKLLYAIKEGRNSFQFL